MYVCMCVCGAGGDIRMCMYIYKCYLPLYHKVQLNNIFLSEISTKIASDLSLFN